MNGQQIDAWWRPPKSMIACLALACLPLAGCGDGGEDSSLAEPASAREGQSVESASNPSPVDFALEIARGKRCEREKKIAEAREIYQRLAESYPERYEPYHRLGNLADRRQRFEEANGWYEQALRLEPRDAEFYNDLGYSRFLQGRLEEAERELLKAVALNPTHARSRNNLGLVYGHLGRHQEALEQFLQGGNEADAHYNLGYVLASLEDFSRARRCIQRALAADPQHERAQKALEEFRQLDQRQAMAGRDDHSRRR